jgi:iron complex transport system permease protein
MNNALTNSEIIATMKKGRAKRDLRYALLTALLGFTVFALCCAAMMLGYKIYPVAEVFEGLFGESLKGAGFAIKYVRLPRMLVCLFSGLAFGIAGNTFQTMLRNPLANPNVVGVTSGSSAAAVFCLIIIHTNQAATFIAAVFGGLITVAIIFLLTMTKTYSAGRLILIGIGIQAMLNSLISYMLLIGADTDIPATIRWLSGSTNSIAIEDIYPLMIVVFALFPVILSQEKNLSILLFGEQTAKTLGVKTNLTRILLLVCAVCLTAFATATTGPIAFISFLSGLISKRIVGTDRVGTLAAGFTGAILVLGADLIGQFALPLKYPVGVITGILGAPALIFLIVKMHRKGVL